MLKYFISLICSIWFGLSIAQSDSTDLTLYYTESEITTGLDSILFLDKPFQQLNLDFNVVDSMSFNKVHVELMEVDASTLLFRKSYHILDLEEEDLIIDWEVSIPFGNVIDTNSYQVSIIIEQYDGSLGSLLSKTITP